MRLLVVGGPGFLVNLDRQEHTVIPSNYEGAVARFYAEKPDIVLVSVIENSDMGPQIIQYIKLTPTPCLAVILSEHPSTAMFAASKAEADRILINPTQMEIATTVADLTRPTRHQESRQGG